MRSASFDSASLPLGENDLSRRYLEIITNWVPIAMATYQDWPVRPNCGHFFGGVHWYGMETSYTIMPIAAAVSSPEFDAKLAGHSADELRETVLHGLRYLLFTHDTGPADCVRPSEGWSRPVIAGTKWGERGKGFFRESQCAWTISAMVQAAALIKDLLTDEDLEMLGAVAADYLQRFRDISPANGVYDNTQTEENAWTALGLVAALVMLPDIEDADKLWEHVKLWMFRTSTVPQDAQNGNEFGGKTVRDWCGRTFTTLPDFTAENHGLIHPTYMGSSVVISGIAMDILTLFGVPIPPQMHWHRGEVYDINKRWCDSLGHPQCPQGMDWPYMRFGWVSAIHSTANCYYRDPDAAALERRPLSVLENASIAHDGAMIPADVKQHCHSVQDPMIMDEITSCVIAQTYLRHRLNGPGVDPAPEEEVRSRLQGVQYYPAGGLVLHNHPNGVTSFSWRNRTMALPTTREGIKLIGPAGNSLLGTYVVSGRGYSENNRKVVVRELPDRVSTLLIQDLAGDTIRRNIFFCSLPDGRGISYEVAHALADITVDSCTLGYLQIINDSFFGPESSRRIHWSGGEEEFRGYITGSAEDDITRDLSGSDWINVDDRMGFRFHGTGSANYLNKHFFPVYHAIYDELTLGRHPQSPSFKSGDRIAELAVLWLPEQDHEATTRERFEILKTPPDIFAAILSLSKGDGWLCACNFGPSEFELDGVVLEPMEPRLIAVK